MRTVRDTVAVLLLTALLSAGCRSGNPPQAEERKSGPAFKVSPDALVKDLRAGTANAYRWTPFVPEGSVYTDRFYTYANVPDPMLGFPVLLSANDDKLFSADKTLLTFTALRRLRVFVLYSAHNALLVESWLNDRHGWLRGSWAVDTTLKESKSLRTVRSRVFGPGERIELGGTGCTAEDCDSYTVLVVPAE